MKYLIDSLASLEEGHQDALSPVAIDVSNSYLGEVELLKPATKGDLRQLADLMDRTQQTTTCHIATTATESPPYAPTTIAPSIITVSRGISMPLGDPELRTHINQSECLPIPGVTIPNLNRRRNSWQEAVEQWERGDPTKHFLPLKDWPTEWYTGKMRELTGAKRQMRKLIAEEYE